MSVSDGHFRRNIVVGTGVICSAWMLLKLKSTQPGFPAGHSTHRARRQQRLQAEYRTSNHNRRSSHCMQAHRLGGACVSPRIL